MLTGNFNDLVGAWLKDAFVVFETQNITLISFPGIVLHTNKSPRTVQCRSCVNTSLAPFQDGEGAQQISGPVLCFGMLLPTSSTCHMVLFGGRTQSRGRCPVSKRLCTMCLSDGKCGFCDS